MKATIYYLFDSRTPGQARYIGVTFKNHTERLAEHLEEARFSPHKKSHKLNWIRSLLKDNIEPACSVIETLDSTEENIFSKEKEYIVKYKLEGHKLTNTTEGGIGSAGHIVTREVREILSKKVKEFWAKMSPEEKERRRLINKQKLRGNSNAKKNKNK